jgi:predicted GNAT family acetyltransferase
MFVVEELDARHYSATDARAIAELLCLVWPKPEKPVDVRQEQLMALGREYEGPENQHPRSYVIRVASRVIAHAGLIPRTIGTSARGFTIAGLSRVCSDPTYRGRGLGELVVREVFKLVDAGVFPFALFQTSHKVKAFYEKLGAAVVTNRIVNSLADEPSASPFWDEVVLRYPENRNWPKGEIDLHGPGY